MISLLRRQSTSRLRPDDLLQKTLGGASQTVVAEFWEMEDIVTTTGKCRIKRFGGVPGVSVNRGVW